MYHLTQKGDHTSFFSSPKQKSCKKESRKRKQTFESVKTQENIEILTLHFGYPNKRAAQTSSTAGKEEPLVKSCFFKLDSSERGTQASSTAGEEEPLVKPCFVRLDSSEVDRYFTEHNILMPPRENRLHDTRCKQKTKDQDNLKTRKLDSNGSKTVTENQDSTVKQATQQSAKCLKNVDVGHRSMKIDGVLGYTDKKSILPCSEYKIITQQKISENYVMGLKSDDSKPLLPCNLENVPVKPETTMLVDIKQEPVLPDPNSYVNNVSNSDIIDISLVKNEDIEIGPTQFYNEEEKTFQDIDELPLNNFQLNVDPQYLDSLQQTLNLQNESNTTNVQNIQLMVIENKVLLVTSLNDFSQQETQTSDTLNPTLAISDITSLFHSISSIPTTIENSSLIAGAPSTSMESNKNLCSIHPSSNSPTPLTIGNLSLIHPSSNSPTPMTTGNSSLIHPSSNSPTPLTIGNSSLIYPSSNSPTPLTIGNSSLIHPSSNSSSPLTIGNSSLIHHTSNSSTPLNTANSSLIHPTSNPNTPNKNSTFILHNLLSNKSKPVTTEKSSLVHHTSSSSIKTVENSSTIHTSLASKSKTNSSLVHFTPNLPTPINNENPSSIHCTSNSSTLMTNENSFLIPCTSNDFTAMKNKNPFFIDDTSNAYTPTNNQASLFSFTPTNIENPNLVHFSTNTSIVTPTTDGNSVYIPFESNSFVVVPTSDKDSSITMTKNDSYVTHCTSNSPTPSKNRSPSLLDCKSKSSVVTPTTVKNSSIPATNNNSSVILQSPTTSKSTVTSNKSPSSIKSTSNELCKTSNNAAPTIISQEKIDKFYNHLCHFHLKLNEDLEPSLYNSNLIQIIEEDYVGTLRCYQCNAHFKDGLSFIQHFSANHRIKKGPSMCCKLCKMCHRDIDKIQCHLMRSHSQYWNHFVGENTTFRCVECEELFIEKSMIHDPYENSITLKNIHLTRVYNLPKKTDFGFMYKLLSKSVPLSNRFSCLLCKVPSYFVAKQKFDDHFKTHLNDYAYKVCRKCQKICHNINDYYDHHEECIKTVNIREEWDMFFESRKWFLPLTTVVKWKKECLECPELFINNCSFRIHMVERHGFELFGMCKIPLTGGNYMCLACKVVFKDTKLFLAHCVPFSGFSTPIPQYCHACNIVYSSTALYEEHSKNVHSTQQCKICDKKTKTAQNLDEHICTEHNVQLVHCTWCSTDVRIKSNHFKSCQPTNLVCPVCGFVCQTVKFLIEHINIDLNLLPLHQFQCKFCLNYFFTEFNLCAHIYNSKCGLKLCKK